MVRLGHFRRLFAALFRSDSLRHPPNPSDSSRRPPYGCRHPATFFNAGTARGLQGPSMPPFSAAAENAFGVRKSISHLNRANK